MRTRRLGGTDLELTEIGLGTWAMGGGDWSFAWGPQDDQASIAAIRRALELGINWIDTAPAYGLGHAEEVVGQALEGWTPRPIIATKCGRSFQPGERQLFACLKRDVIRAEAEASLRRLKIDCIDLYQIHWPQPDEDIEEAWTTITELIREGKVRYGGVSNFSVSQMQRLEKIAPLASLQPPYSFLAPQAEKELLPYCAAHKIGVVVYSPLQKGLLTGAFTAERVLQLPQDDHRRRDPMFQEPQLTKNLEAVEMLRRLGKETDQTVAQVALAWVLRRPEVTAAIVGARRPAQIEETIRAASDSPKHFPDPPH